jgi:hypothetical protein
MRLGFANASILETRSTKPQSNWPGTHLLCAKFKKSVVRMTPRAASKIQDGQQAFNLA